MGVGAIEAILLDKKLKYLDYHYKTTALGIVSKHEKEELEGQASQIVVGLSVFQVHLMINNCKNKLSSPTGEKRQLVMTQLWPGGVVHLPSFGNQSQ